MAGFTILKGGQHDFYSCLFCAWLLISSRMSLFAQHIARLQYAYAHHELHDLTDERSIQAYYKVMLWVYGSAAISGAYE